MANARSANEPARVVINGNNTTGNIDISSNGTSPRVNATNDAAQYYAEQAKMYAEQAQQDVDEIVDGMTGTNDIVLTKDGRNITISTKCFVYNQAVASSIWVIEHGLNKAVPRITVIDNYGNVFYPAIEVVNANKCIIKLLGAMSGTAYLD